MTMTSVVDRKECDMMYVLIVLVCFMGGALQSLTGFGCSVILMSLLPHFIFPLTQVAGITGVISLLSSFSLVLYYRRTVRFRVIIPIFVIYSLIMPFSSYLSLRIEPNILRFVLGLVLTAISLHYLLFSNKVIRLSENFVTAAIVGLVSGALSGLLTVGGPPVILYTMSVSNSKDDYLGMTQFFFTISNFYSSAVRVIEGIVTFEILPWIIVGVVGVLSGMFLANLVLDKFNWDILQRCVYIMIGIIGLNNLLQSL